MHGTTHSHAFRKILYIYTYMWIYMYILYDQFAEEWSYRLTIHLFFKFRPFTKEKQKRKVMVWGCDLDWLVAVIQICIYQLQHLFKYCYYLRIWFCFFFWVFEKYKMLSLYFDLLDIFIFFIFQTQSPEMWVKVNHNQIWNLYVDTTLDRPSINGNYDWMLILCISSLFPCFFGPYYQ